VLRCRVGEVQRAARRGRRRRGGGGDEQERGGGERCGAARGARGRHRVGDEFKAPGARGSAFRSVEEIQISLFPLILPERS
jgi:hypothetical protein